MTEPASDHDRAEPATVVACCQLAPVPVSYTHLTLPTN